MNIQQATEQIQGAISAYLAKDEHGLPCIPHHMQRPIIMFGPPGVGKTAIVSQVARQAGINFVSYSITHHTRQSALGLPFIVQEDFAGHHYSISEYTMSEIIASVYRAQEKTGIHQGILFLDEINCVSETLAPAMLQFLQYKKFGTHELPEGWIIVTAGNPPEYNRSAREFDPAMMDRLKRIDIEPDLQVWEEYAASHGVHPAITTFLESKPGSFYNVQANARGTSLVTARGWEDLSRMLQAYERVGLQANETLVRQYLQDDATAVEFSAYYQLFRKYQDDYKVADILDGANTSVPTTRVQAARFDERLALVGLIADALQQRVHAAVELEQALFLVRGNLLELKEQLSKGAGEGSGEGQGAGEGAGAGAGAAAGAGAGVAAGAGAGVAAGADEGEGADASAQATLTPAQLLLEKAHAVKEAPCVNTLPNGAALVGEVDVIKAEQVRCLEELAHAVSENSASSAPLEEITKNDSALTPFDLAKGAYNKRVKELRAKVAATGSSLDNAFLFIDGALGESSQESLILTTKLSLDPLTVRFVGQYGSEQYMKHNKSLLLSDRNVDLLSEIQALESLDE